MPEPVDCTYKTADGTELPMRLWRPERGGAACPPGGNLPGRASVSTAPGALRAAVVYLHGIQSHGGWYEASSRHLASAGIAVYQIERRGSGRDAAHERGHVDRAETWLADVAAAAEVARTETGLSGVYLMGVSWGGKLAAACAAHRPDLYRGLILSAPGIVPRVDLTLVTKVRVAEALAAGHYLRRFPIPLEDPHLFTENAERLRFIAEDPLSLRELTARFLFESRRLDRMVRETLAAVRAPTLLALAEHDRIISNSATRRRFLAMPVRRRLLMYQGAHHTLEFEPDPAPYFRDLVSWIDEVEADARRP